MSFISITFLIFFVISLLLMYIVQKFFNYKYSLIILLILNYIFYSYWDARFSLLLFLMTLIIYFCSLNINKKICYYIGILIPVITLCFFKYFNFFLETINVRTLNIIIPMGISFYTFEIVSYVVDIKKDKYEAEKDFIKFATYISFFPNIVSGPIIRANKILNQFKEEKKTTINNIKIGIQIMAIGYFKKMVIADRLAVFVDDVYKTPNAFSSLTTLLAVLTYSIQIYMDFSGYSDIAIGVAKCFGFDLEPNFNVPYISKSVTEFWRRWHISLSTWFKDYVYIPLGGNKKGKLRQYINLIIVMTLSGLWHGASWTYVIWGLINGLLLVFEKLFIRDKENINIINIFRIIFNYLLISITWIFFRAESFDKALQIIKNILMFKEGINQPYIWSFIFIVLMIMINIFVYIKNNDKNRINAYYPIQDLDTIKGQTLFFILIGLILILCYTNSNPFVYFKF